ncbi:hypothetical protein FRC04_008885 [Tulasnella sp. 424]|nr:hypothetical protein FRC04_008885 [Tulasnella sp. 424]KAG8973785.1 hypothetical protein FRC05_008204 [Tulasnella sp. 425]
MYSSDESGSSGLRRTTSLSTGTRGARVGNTRQQRAFRRHKRFSFSTETLGTLPEYSPSRGPPTRPRPLLLSEQNDDTANPVQAWANDVAVASPPPTYPGYEDGAPQEGEFGEAKDPAPLSPISASTPPRPRRVRRVRSSGRMNDRLDQLLERSVMALEASNALLQSSLTTHSSLAAVLADSSFDRSMDVQIRYLARRMGAEGSQENGLDKVLEEVVGLISSSGLEDAQLLAPPSSVENAAANREIRSGAISSMGYDNDGLTRSLPAEDHMEQMRMQQLASSPSSTKLRRNKPSAGSQQKRLRLSDGPRPRSPPPRPFTQAISVESPNRVGYEKNEGAETIVLPSTSGTRTAPQEIPLYDPLPSATITISSGSNIYQPSSSSQPETPVTPSAYTMLSHIQSRSSSISRAASPEAFKTTFRNSPRISVKALPPDPESPVPTRGRGMGDVRPGLSVGWKATERPSSPFGTQKTWPQGLRSQSSESRNPYEDEETLQTPPTSSRMPSASMFDLRSTLETPPKPPRLTLQPEADEVGFLPSTSYKVSLSLRKILAEAENQSTAPVSEVAKGKQRAEGERPDDMLPASARPKYTRSLNGRTSSPLTLLTAPSISHPAIVREDFSKHMSQHRPSASLGSLAPVIRDELGAGPSATGTVTPRRSALKGSSGRTTPLSSGQSSPRVVTFSPLPPKYESDGSVGRARAKNKTKAKEAKDAKQAEKGGWLTQWLLGSAGDLGTRTFTPVHSRTGSLLREEGRWHGGIESWQI